MSGIYVRVKNREQFEAVFDSPNADAIICGFGCSSILSSGAYADDKEKKIYVELPEVARENKIGSIEKAVNYIAEQKIHADGVVVENLDELGILLEKAFKGRIIGGSFLYAYNSEAVKFYRKCFKDIRLLAPDELTLDEIHDIETGFKQNTAEDDNTPDSGRALSENGRISSHMDENIQYSDREISEYSRFFTQTDVSGRTKSENIGYRYINKKNNAGEKGIFIYKIYGHQPVMITNQCMNRNYCGCMKPKLEFRDYKNNNFYITSECGQCYDVVYNGPVTYMLDRLEEIGDRDLLLDFTVESGTEVKQVMELLENAISGIPQKIEKYTRGHFYKGID